MSSPLKPPRTKASRVKPAGFPTRTQIMQFIEESDAPAGKREIARAFGLKGQEKIALKSLLKDMADEGLIDIGPARAFHKMGGVPKVTVLRIVDVDGSTLLAVPERWEAEGVPPPRLRIMERGKRSALTVGDRILARTEEAGAGWVAHPMKKLAKGEELLLGVVEQQGEGGALLLRPVDKRNRNVTRIVDLGNAKPGDLVLAEAGGRAPKMTARITDVLGDPFAAKSFSLIAIHKFGIPFTFPDSVEDEALAVADLPLHEAKREDLRHLPIVAIDPVDARDFDDAVWAAPDEDEANAGGFRAIVAIADVSYYVRPGGKLDREARKRGNSVYFPDRVVPMLPHQLSSDMCSLRAEHDRAAMACHLVIDKHGKVTSWRFTRAVIRVAANIPYEQAQAAVDGEAENPFLETALKPLWACWALLAKARDKREPLDLDLPERRVVLDEAGKIVSVAIRERLDAHRLIEDFMIAANVAAAKALEAKKAPVMYRVHEPPSREKLIALKDYLKTFDVEFALGQVIRPSTFNRLIAKIGESDVRPQIMEQILRTQTQAYYGPENAGHFGLSLGSYAHFTSPIRRYADLLVHRALVGAYGLELPAPKDKSLPDKTSLSGEDMSNMGRVGELISQHERRAMEAERETVDRYVAAFLALRVGEVLEARITGVQSFGFFATVEGLGGDGLVPVSTLGAERFMLDEASRTLVGMSSGERYTQGQRLPLRLVEADPINGSLRFELPEGASHLPFRGPNRGPGRPSGGLQRRGRPANIRHSNNPRGKNRK
ncbi:ribonuclease R [Sphingobium sp. SCG-1]|uniref:ribonuclease R n=1 Tax=Sphingobium sp. SCG-1 TaxID=2072936 RepID=UPI000CD6A4D8|nr:ribonuclease R [Sphingobium sp. SCG-1]AUW58622.1 ribonuclease R [Sphingobium sp. SCG-1]